MIRLKTFFEKPRAQPPLRGRLLIASSLGLFAAAERALLRFLTRPYLLLFLTSTVNGQAAITEISAPSRFFPDISLRANIGRLIHNRRDSSSHHAFGSPRPCTRVVSRSLPDLGCRITEYRCEVRGLADELDSSAAPLGVILASSAAGRAANSNWSAASPTSSIV